MCLFLYFAMCTDRDLYVYTYVHTIPKSTCVIDMRVLFSTVIVFL